MKSKSWRRRANENANGVSSFSPGCRVREATLGHRCFDFPQPQRGCVGVAARHAATPLGLMNILIRLPRVVRSSQPWAERRYPVGVNPRHAPWVDRLLAAKRQNPAAAPAGRHLCRMASPENPSSVRSGIFRPDEALNLSRLWFYKDSAPDGALACSAHGQIKTVETASTAH